MTTRRQTIQKQAVLEAVRGAQPAHPTAADIFAAVRPALPSLSFGTVYRVLHGLTEEGEIQEVPHAGGPTRYDGNTEAHHHVVCSQCGSVGDVHLAPGFVLGECGRPQTDFDIESFRLEFLGICPVCRAASAPPCQERNDATPC
jgi:Fe2+ or Zn2+ uptake regulation protein